MAASIPGGASQKYDLIHSLLNTEHGIFCILLRPQAIYRGTCEALRSVAAPAPSPKSSADSLVKSNQLLSAWMAVSQRFFDLCHEVIQYVPWTASKSISELLLSLMALPWSSTSAATTTPTATAVRLFPIEWRLASASLAALLSPLLRPDLGWQIINATVRDPDAPVRATAIGAFACVYASVFSLLALPLRPFW